MKKLLFLLFLNAALFYSCEYEPVEIYNRTVNQNVAPPQLQVVQLNLEKDTVFIYDIQRNLQFNFTTNNQTIKTVRFLLDNKEIYSVNSNTGSFWFLSQDFTIGTHTLQLQVYTNSGTNSIADILGAEGYRMIKSWVVMVYDINNVHVNSSAVNGNLKLSWAQYRGTDLLQYTIEKSAGSNTYSNLGSTNALEYTDVSYAGEGASYAVYVQKKSGDKLFWGNGGKPSELPKMTYTMSGANQYKICWNKSKYYNAIDTIQLLREINYRFVNVKTTSDPNDTTYSSADMYFGDYITFTLKVIPKKSNPTYIPDNHEFFENITGVLLAVSLTVPNDFLQNFTQVSQSEFIYLSPNNGLFRYSTSKKQIVDHLSYMSTICPLSLFNTIKVSSSGKYITSQIPCDNKTMLIKSGDMNNYVIQDLQQFTGSPPIPVSDMAVGLLYSTGGFYIYDFNSRTSLAFYQKPNVNFNSLNISPNGDYIFYTNDSLHLLHYSNAQFNTIWEQPLSNYKLYGFDESNANQLYIWDGTKLSIKLCSDFSTLSENATNGENIANIDFFNKEVLTYKTGHYYVRNLSDWTLLYDLPVRYSQYSDPPFGAYVFNNAIVTNTAGLIQFFK